MSEENLISRRGPASPTEPARAPVRALRRGRRVPPQRMAYDPTPDEHGLTAWHYWGGRQFICGTCNCHPCPDSCTEQFCPDRVEWKAARANVSDVEWAALHADWIAAHATRPDVAAWLEGQRREHEPAAREEQRIPVDAAMKQAMAVVAGEARAEDALPVYEEASPGS